MEDNILNISFIQTDLQWEEPSANLASFEEKISTLNPKNQLVIIPEMFNAGFSMEYSEPTNHTTSKWMRSVAQRNQIHLLGSAAITENGKKYNRALIYKPNGTLEFYDKKHLFGLGNENLSFSSGNNSIVFEINGWRIKPLICYDLRFPVWCRNQPPYYDVLVFIASWPKVRIDAWTSLLKARAIENQCYVIGVNRIGTDGNGLVYNGQSAIYDFNGEPLAFAGEKDVIIESNLSLSKLKKFRENLPFLNDADIFEIK